MRLIDDALEGSRMVQERFPQSALSQLPGDFKKRVQTGSSGTKFDRLCCTRRNVVQRSWWAVHIFFWWKVLPGKFRESSRLVLPRLGYHGWLGYFALCG